MRWNELVKARIKELNTSQEAIAEKIGMTPGGLGHWLNSRRVPSIDQVSVVLKAVGVNQVTLNSDGTVEIPYYQKENVTEPISTKEHPAEYRANKLPVISLVQAGNWSEAIENEHNEYLETTEKVGPGSFWLQVSGDSMTSGYGLSFPDGMYICVDPNKEALNKSFVVAKLESVNEATFKQLVIDVQQRFLKPLNPIYSPIPVSEDCKIVGVVVDAKWKLKNE
ncbi:LexA family transcriptional regulator [Vibrio sp. 2175-1]|uniref:LexA family protein n=1 Tax=Vibrio TaxID=662 RepID=UPI001CDCCE21|nr:MULTISPECIES: LexA family transcriptional regulator [Vibrio]MCA2497807.1 LexA family transcriptional regulator [Vibrio alginolyticus]MDW2217494.1 LexA family transcriptional regulator [Vibrio sp. 2175-1]